MAAYYIMQRDRQKRTFLFPESHDDHRTCDQAIRRYADNWRKSTTTVHHYPGLSVVRFHNGTTMEFWRANRGERERYQSRRHAA